MEPVRAPAEPRCSGSEDPRTREMGDAAWHLPLLLQRTSHQLSASSRLRGRGGASGAPRSAGRLGVPLSVDQPSRPPGLALRAGMHTRNRTQNLLERGKALPVSSAAPWALPASEPSSCRHAPHPSWVLRASLTEVWGTRCCRESSLAPTCSLGTWVEPGGPRGARTLSNVPHHCSLQHALRL